MSSWGDVFRFMVAFGGWCVVFVGAMVLFLWAFALIDKMDDKEKR